MFWISVLLFSLGICGVGLLLNLPVWVPPLAGLMILAVVVRISGNAERRLLERCGDTEPESGNYPRITNLVDALCLTTGVSAPEIRVLRSSASNIAAIGRSPDKSTLILTTGLIESVSRVALEAVLANRIAQITNYRVALTTTTLTTFGLTLGSTRIRIWPLLPLGLLSGGRLAKGPDLDSDFSDDAAGVTVTRYPPGMVEALEILENQHQVAGTDAHTSPLWLLDPSNGAERPSVQARIASLREM